MLVHLSTDDQGKVDVYIDDLIAATAGIEGSNQLMNSDLLAIDLLSRHYIDFPLPRKPMVAMDKLLVEVGLSETKTVLGWIYDTRLILDPGVAVFLGATTNWLAKI